MQPKDQIFTRMYVLLSLLGIIPFVVAAQVLRLGLWEDDRLREIGENEAETEITIPALRGAIIDHNDRVLAGDRVREAIVLDPTTDGFDVQRREHIQTLARAMGVSTTTVEKRIRNRESRRFVTLSRDVFLTPENRAAVADIPGVSVQKEFARYYNYGRSASHILGYVDTDMKGLEGIERQYDEFLSGTPGQRSALRDRRGVRKLLPGGDLVRPAHGETVKLTIDIVRQSIMEEELALGTTEAGAKWAVAIAMDPRSGAILGMANVPTYDVNQPGTANVASRKNAAIANRIEPGSTFKLVAAITAVETGAVAMTDSFETGNGYARIAGWPVRDTHGYGTIPFTEVISVSSNIGFAQLSERLDPGKYFQYARALGFGQVLGIDLPGEESGRLRRPTNWSGSTMSSMSRGYGVDATALQILAAYSALANGGVLVKPHIVSERRDVNGRTIWRAETDSLRRVFSEETARTLLPAFEEVVLTGTAENAQLENIRVAGKTGTAKKAAGGSYTAGKYRASFAGFFPADDPQVAMIVVMDEPRSSIYGGYTAAPVFRRIAERWLYTMPEIQPDRIFVSRTDSIRAISPPDVTTLPYSVAQRKMSAFGVQVETSGTPHAFDIVEDQIAMGGGAENAPVRFRLNVSHTHTDTSGLNTREEVEATVESDENEDDRMPDLIGLGARDAAFILANHGITARFDGSGRVVSQFPKAGSELIQDALLRLK